MSKPIPTLQKYMTTTPHTIGKDQKLAAAYKIMRDNHIRHLPVLDGGALVGILSDRDVHFIESLQGVDPDKVSVEDAMTAAPYTVGPNTGLDEVVSTMAEHRYGSAVVMQNEKVVGIFTAVDALGAFAELLHTRLAK